MAKLVFIPGTHAWVNPDLVMVVTNIRANNRLVTEIIMVNGSKYRTDLIKDEVVARLNGEKA